MHSLKSLPIANESQQHLEGKSSDNKNKDINIELVQNSANWLRRVLGLSIFGFDVVVSNSSSAASSLSLFCFFNIVFPFYLMGEGLFMFHVYPIKELPIGSVNFVDISCFGSFPSIMSLFSYGNGRKRKKARLSSCESFIYQ